MKRTLLYFLLCLGTAIPPGMAWAADEPGVGPEVGKPAAVVARGDKAEATGAADKKGGPLTQSSLFISGSAKEAPWRGSQFVWRTAISALTLDRGSEQTYNPYAAMTFGFRPWWWFTEHIYVRGNLDVTRELTEADTNTYEGEATVSDLLLFVGGAALYTIPVVGVHVSADLALTVPTSKLSRAQTLVLSLAPGLRLSRSFAWRGGISLGYNLRLTPRFYRYTTAQRETPLIPGCASGCGEAFYNLGARNPYLRLSQSADVSIKFLPWLGASLVVGHAVDWLYAAADDGASSTVEDASSTHLTFFEAAVSFRPLDLLEIGVGYSALHPQLAPDSSRYVPFFNRYSVFFVDLKLHAQGVVSRVRRMFQ